MKTKTSWVLTFIVVFFAMSVLVSCGGEAKTVAVPIEMPPVYFVVPEEPKMAPMTIPEPYKGWGWTVQEYDSLLLCKSIGGKMGSSKNCRIPDSKN